MTNPQQLNPTKTGLLMVDLQNDFLHPAGAYARGGQANSEMSVLPERILPVAKAIRASGGWIISTQFTLVPGKGGEPFISPHLRKLRPFLRMGDFAPGSWGNRLVDTLKPADIVVEKIAYSAFYMTRMEWVLRKAGIETLLICGIVTNGGVASTLRDAHVRDFSTILLTDGCAAFSSDAHRNAIADLCTITEPMTCVEAVGLIAKL